MSETKLTKAGNLHVIGFGSSAGGLETLQELLSKLPADLGFAFVIVQHLSPNHTSLMHELLASHTGMPVLVVEEKIQLRSNHIYLISKDWDLALHNSYLVPLVKKQNSSPKSPIDRFLISMASSMEERSVGIILSGTGTDGTHGVRAIKAKGGIVIVQKPGSAKFDGMPQAALDTGTADFVLDVPDIAERLKLLAQQLREGRILGENEGNQVLEKILQHLKSSININFTYYRTPTLLRRIDKRCKIVNVCTLEDYYQYLIKEDNESHLLAQEFLIGVSSFFRDEFVWRSLEKNVIPQLFEGKQTGEQLRVWVGGCSTGEEAYTLAILLNEYKIRSQKQVDFKIFASDLDNTAIKIASKGLYGTDIVQQVPYLLLNRYFEREEKGYRIEASLRDKVVFAQHNLISDPPFIRMDLISCRNTLIYFTPASQQKLISKFHFALNTGGFLLLGSSESLGSAAELFRSVDKGTNIFQNIEERKRQDFISDHRATTTILKDRRRNVMLPDTSSDSDSSYVSDNFAAILAKEHAPTSIFINEQFDVLYIHCDADKYLSLPKRSLKLNLLKMLNTSEQLIIRKGIEKAEQEKITAFKEVSLNKGKTQHLVDLRFKEVWVEAQKSKTYLIEIFRRENESSKSESTPVLNPDRLLLLERELAEKDRQLKFLKEKLETSSEQLQASNEELHTSNHELQSANEELQSVNEELHTLNSELKQKIEEVTASNTDIDNLFTSTNIATLFLDQDLKIRKHTPRLRELIRITENDVGRSIADFNTSFRNYNIEDDAQEVLRTQQTLEREVITKNGKYFLSRISLYRQQDGSSKGVVVLYIDLTEKHKVETEVKETADRLSLVLETSKTGYVELHLATNKLFYDKQYAQIMGLAPGEQKSFEQLMERVHPDDKEMLEKQLKNSIENGENILTEYRTILPKTMEVRYLYSHARAIRNEKGEVVKLVGAIQDQTDRIQQEQESLWYWKLLQESQNEIYIFDARSLRFITVNYGAQKNIGYTAEEFKQLTAINIKPDFSWNEFEELLTPLRTGQTKLLRYHTTHQRKDRSTYPVLANLQLGNYQGRDVYIAIIQDITELVKVQEELKAINERYDFAIRGTSDGIWDWPDINTSQLYWSPRIYELYGMKPGEVEPTMENLMSLIHPDDVERTRLAVKAHLEHETPYDIEVRMHHKTRGYRWFRARGQSVRNKECMIYRMAGSLTDVHQRKQDELELREINRRLELANNYLDNFVYTAAHDLRAPVSNLRTLIGMLQSDEKLSENVNFMRVVQSANRLEDTLQGMVRILEIQRNDSPEVSSLNIAEIFRLIRSELAEEEKEAKASIVTTFRVQEINYVKPFLQSILRNLLSNALKYRSNDRDLVIEVSTKQAGEYVLLEVKDNGIGLDVKRYGKKLFKPFERLTKQAEGQGLGLHLVKTMLERNGGSIKVEGETNKGLHFKLYLKPYLLDNSIPVNTDA
jgi:two-component system CheB/CheR fusion protein